MQKQPFLYLLVFCIMGILLADSFQHFFSSSMVIIGWVILLFGLLLYVLTPKIFPSWWGGFMLGVSGLYLFFIFHLVHLSQAQKIDFEGKQQFQFTPSKKLNSTPKYRKYKADVIVFNGEKPQESFRALLYIDKSLPELDFTQVYYSQAYIRALESTAQDFQFDYARYLSRQGMYHQAFIRTYDQVEDSSPGFSQWIKQRRQSLLNRIDRAGLSPTTKSFLKGIILADRTEMEQEMIWDFRRTGLMHLLAISGGHIVIIFGVILFILKYGFVFLSYRARIMMALGFVWLFTIFIDFGNSVVRSSLMLSIYYGAIVLQKPPNLFHSASISALIMLLMDTHAIFDIGFQMSYSAVMGIGLFYVPLLSRMYGGALGWKKFFFSIMSITIAAQIGTFPLVLYHFHQYSLVSFLANLIIVPMAEVLIVASSGMALLYAVVGSFWVLESGYDFLVQLTLRIIHHLGSSQMMFIENIPFNGIELIIVYICIYLFYRWIARNRASLVTFLMALICFFIARLGTQMYWDAHDEHIEFVYNKQKVKITKQHRRVEVEVHGSSMDDAQKEKFHQYIIMPYLIDRRQGEVKSIIYTGE